MPPQLVTVEGIIGAGKTTVARHIASTMPDTRFFPAPGRSSNPHWNDFHLCPEQHALAMQCWFLRERLRVYTDALAHMRQTKESVVLDFSLWSDEAFAISHYENGFMRADELEAYTRLMRRIDALGLPPPHLTIVLHAAPEVCLRRAEGLERPMLSEAYLARLDELHRQRFVRDLGKVFTPRWLRSQRVAEETPGLAAAPSAMTLVRDWSDLSKVRPTGVVDAVMSTPPVELGAWLEPMKQGGFAEGVAAILRGST
mmetsp:Transcript_14443/g.33028  ORF Transcript_14443/g.33028 Transcript_14443/m.33028 type:complete len:256 (-) Transcript_14443:72-839(-)